MERFSEMRPKRALVAVCDADVSEIEKSGQFYDPFSSQLMMNAI